jgi:hypothetical protein
MAAITCAEYMEQQRANGRYNISYDEIWDAAIKSVEENGSSHNKQSTPCKHVKGCRYFESVCNNGKLPRCYEV